MEPTKAKTIIAFYNKLAEVFGVEDSNTLSELRQMIPIIINFIQSGDLVFIDNPDSGFAAAVEYLRSNGDEGMYTHLDADAAENAHELEIAKVLVSLMYELRVARPNIFTTYCDKLTADENAELAEMIKFMDDRQSWALAPWQGALFNAGTNKENHQPSTPQNSKTMNFPLQASPCLRTASRSIYHSPARSTTTSRTFGLDSSSYYTLFNNVPKLSFNADGTNNRQSPVAKVVNSPRGEEVTKMRQLKRTATEQKELLEKLGKDRDHYEERCTEQTKIIACLRDNIQSLEKRVVRLRHDTVNMDKLERELDEMRTAESSHKKDVQFYMNNYHEATAARKQLVAERDAAVQRFELQESELAQVKADFDNVIRRERDLVETLEDVKRELLDNLREHSTVVTNYQQKIRQLEDQLDHREKSWKIRFDEKDRELLSQIQLMNDVQMKQGTLAQQLEEEHQLTEENKLKNLTIQQLRQQLVDNTVASNLRIEQAQKKINSLEMTLREKEQNIDGLLREKFDSELRIPQLHQCYKTLKADFKAARDNWYTTEDTKNAKIGELKREVAALREQMERQTVESDATKGQLTALSLKYSSLERVHALCNSSNISQATSSRSSVPAIPFSTSRFSKFTKTSSPSKLSRTQKSFRQKQSDKVVDEEARLKELRERNAKMPRALQSHYLPETQQMKGDVGLKP